MGNLFRHEFYKLWKNKTLWVTLGVGVAIVVLFSGIQLYSEWWAENYGDFFTSISDGQGGTIDIPIEPRERTTAVSALLSAAGMCQVWAILAMVVICSFVVTEYNRGNIRNLAMSGNARWKIYSVKLTLAVLTTVAFFAIFAILHMIIFWAWGGWGSVGAGELALVALILFLQTIAIAAFVLFFADLTQSSGAVFGVFFLALIAFAIIGGFSYVFRNNDFLFDAFNFFTDVFVANAMQFVDYGMKTAKVIKYIVSALVTAVGLSALGFWIFEKRDMK
jgi:ABC-type transport system involved in multi-copper enzyme maturation permease subunit